MMNMENNRDFLKDSLRKQFDFSRTDQSRGVDMPPIQKPPAPGQPLIQLPSFRDGHSIHEISVLSAIESRFSHRRFADDPLTMQELSFLLWATQGVREKAGERAILRTVPSAGNRHAFETYLIVLHVSGLKNGVYRYLPLDHALVLEHVPGDMGLSLENAALGQTFVTEAAVVFTWAVIPYRMEWRYGPAAHRVIAMDAGHVCQNLYLACETIDCGTCAVAAYDQELMDQFIRTDGKEEFVIYLAPVGKKDIS